MISAVLLGCTGFLKTNPAFEIHGGVYTELLCAAVTFDICTADSVLLCISMVFGKIGCLVLTLLQSVEQYYFGT